jgi:hypothetical protein
MRNEDLLRQAHLDAQKAHERPRDIQQSLRVETDWNGWRLQGYEPRPHPSNHS